MIGTKIKEVLLLERTTNEKLGINSDELLPRYKKKSEIQKERTKTRSEVFTPFYIIKRMNDKLDKNFSGTDEEYISRKVIEVTCGEAPFLVTRYDVSNGNDIEIEVRTGLLDRKLQHIKCNSPEEWCNLASVALKSTYGYEYQKDSLYIARENILRTIMDYYEYTFNSKLPEKNILDFAIIISFNIFRMDGITMCIPETDIPVKIMNWDKNKMERFDGKPEIIGLW